MRRCAPSTRTVSTLVLVEVEDKGTVRVVSMVRRYSVAASREDASSSRSSIRMVFLRHRQSKTRHFALELPPAGDEVLHRGVEFAGDGIVFLRDVQHGSGRIGDSIGLAQLAIERVAHGPCVLGDLLQRGGDAAA